MNKINVVACITPIIYGGDIRVILNKEIEIEVTPDIFWQAITHKQIEICGVVCRIGKYDPEKNILYASNQLHDLSKENIANLVNNGWARNEDGLGYHSSHIH